MSDQINYFALDRVKVYLPLDKAAVSAAFPGVDPRFEEAWHPHVELDPRPTQGAKQWILEKTKSLNETIRRVRLRCEERVQAVYADTTPEAKEKMLQDARAAFETGDLGDTFKAGTWAQYLESETQIKVFCDSEVLAEAKKIKSLKVATYVRRLGGKWECYANAWQDFEDAPDWPALTSDPSTLDRRLAVVFNLAEDDVAMICDRIAPTVELSEEEAGK